ncbi:Helix-turn-helix [Caloranaerobacter azorensis DSM 13643]|uniref:Helix-turn-helix n=1 Tax=Caloranaerobacter azorensis DSM 13643 TaxID=1121264 RepID=A0A1M5TTV0_9FIRM|nr:helix-turn-helix transcriptional regulator [Caloranaerobacter azorensis]SHH54202.1 Helix-turn-helix [Caloranaerobacter azorensis DSM 13643]
MKKIGERIRYFRNKRGITQVQLADMTSIEQTVISRYENGKIIPPISKLVIIARALEVDISDLLKETEQSA